ncbi:MAG: alpha-2-macroglobulin family protein [Planctomycetes bacterium]|nr:alpha-2-macroglobulin family protein [Planctomycetota bacterium]
MVATLYDASLDAFLPHRWPEAIGGFRSDRSNLSVHFENLSRDLRRIHGHWRIPTERVGVIYRSFPGDLIGEVRGYELTVPTSAPPVAFEGRVTDGGRLTESAVPASPPKNALAGERAEVLAKGEAGGSEEEPPGPDLSRVSPRANLNETAFFFPHLVSSAEGQVRIEFTMPEALTEWRFMGFAHDADLRSGYLEDRVVTSKDLMVQPNAPRFVREGDVMEFTVKVTNQSAARQTGTVRLTLADARTGESADAALGNPTTDRTFDIPSKESTTIAWRLDVPDGMGFLTYKAVGSTGRLSDGEEGYLPVLPRRILVTESLPLPIRGPQAKTFDFARLRGSGKSDTLRHQSLTVQMVSQPAWYAVMALPYLMEFPHECSEQVFNRLYANALARHIATSDPRIRRVFDQWRATPALESPLEKNEDLKAVALEETPWVRQAEAESQARRNVGILFGDNRLASETERTLRKLAEMQLPEGAWPWFPGGRGKHYITLYIVTGFGRMRHLGVDIPVEAAMRALAYLDANIDRTYRDILRRSEKDSKEENHLSPSIALYIYGRSFFLKDRPILEGAKEAVDFFLGQAQAHWLKVGNRQSQAHIAIGLKRFGDLETPAAIIRSIREFSASDEELGMFWPDAERSWWWYRAPIETQAMMIEAFDEVAGDAKAVEDCKVWLLKQKQTRDWKTTKATADAVYALLLRGADLLASTALVEVSLGGTTIEPEKVEAGTGFYEKRFPGAEVNPAFGEIAVKKVDAGVSWGSVHWQYLEDMSKITPYAGTPLTLRKSLFVREYTAKGPVLRAIEGPLAVGDELVVRIELRVDRDMEYVHLKDQRGSGTEPVNVLSRYEYQDGLGYYESTRDTASHFFIDYLPKGTYVFEYATRVVHRGRYQSGMAEIQCMYAPEFNAHSESFVLKVNE